MAAKKKAVDVYLSRWPKGSDTGKTMRGALDGIARALGGPKQDADSYPWHEIDYAAARAISAQLRDGGMAPPTINKALSALRGVLDTAWRLGDIADEVYRRIEIKNVRGKALAAGRALEAEEIDAIYGILMLSTPPSRSAALVAVLVACGLRRIEAVRLYGASYDAKTQRLVARGKGDKERSIPVAPRWQPIIETYFKMIGPRKQAFPMARHDISYAVEKFCAEHQLKRFTPHDLRRTFITRVCEKMDVSIAQRLAGHENMNTTGIYDRRGEKAESEAVEDL